MKNHSQPDVAKVEGNLHLPSNSRFASNGKPCADTRRAVFLDRDGVVVEDVHFLREPAQLRVLPGVSQALKMLQERFYIVVATNQSGIARGLINEEQLLDIHQTLVRMLSSEGVLVDGLYYCPHLPKAPVQEYATTCECRKPKPGMILQAEKDWDIDLSQSFLVGDMPRDVQAAQAAAVRGIIIGNKLTEGSGQVEASYDLLGAARHILTGAADMPSGEF